MSAIYDRDLNQCYRLNYERTDGWIVVAPTGIKLPNDAQVLETFPGDIKINLILLPRTTRRRLFDDEAIFAWQSLRDLDPDLLPRC